MRLSVTTPQGSLLDVEVEETIAPGKAGEFGILPGHIPFLSALRPGVLAYRTKDGTKILAVDDGLLQVSTGTTGERVQVLVARAVAVKQIDREATAKEAADLDRELAQWKGDQGGEWQALAARRAWAQARLDAAAR